jgi:hypothetical protein
MPDVVLAPWSLSHALLPFGQATVDLEEQQRRVEEREGSVGQVVWLIVGQGRVGRQVGGGEHFPRRSLVGYMWPYLRLELCLVVVLRQGVGTGGEPARQV